MKDVPGWKVGTWYGEPVYFTMVDKWWDPSQIEVMAHSDIWVESDAYLWRWKNCDYGAPKWWDKYLPVWL